MTDLAWMRVWDEIALWNIEHSGYMCPKCYEVLYIQNLMWMMWKAE